MILRPQDIKGAYEAYVIKIAMTNITFNRKTAKDRIQISQFNPRIVLIRKNISNIRLHKW